MEENIFGKEAADRIAKGREEYAEELKKIETYQIKEKEFLTANPGLSSKDREEKLMKLRIEYLGGKEEAELYSKRMELERELSGN